MCNITKKNEGRHGARLFVRGGKLSTQRAGTRLPSHWSMRLVHVIFCDVSRGGGVRRKKSCLRVSVRLPSSGRVGRVCMCVPVSPTRIQFKLGRHLFSCVTATNTHTHPFPSRFPFGIRFFFYTRRTPVVVVFRTLCSRCLLW